jgi:hypothetical protein
MTKDQFQAAVRSLATELHRVAHKQELPDDDNELAYEVFAARGYIGGAVPDLCPHNLTALAEFVSALHDMAAHDDPDDDAERRPS